jgi:hypothetical protein
MIAAAARAGNGLIRVGRANALDWTDKGLSDYAQSAEPSPEETALRNQVMDHLRQLLQTGRRPHVIVVEGGSFAKGTSVKGKSDCDVVVVCPDLEVNQFAALQQEYKELIMSKYPQARDYIRTTKCVGGVEPTLSCTCVYRLVARLTRCDAVLRARLLRHGIKFRLSGVSVDVIVSGRRPAHPAASAVDEYFFAGETVAYQVGAPRTQPSKAPPIIAQQNPTACAARSLPLTPTAVLQVHAVKDALARTPIALPVIRLLKKWRNEREWGEDKKPTSYFLELVVLRAVQDPEVDKHSLRALTLASFYVMLDLKRTRPSKRHLPDLAAPTNNVANTVSEPVWRRLAKYCKDEVASAEKAR